MLALAFLAALAQATTASEPPITVTGRRPEEVRREAEAFVRSLGVAQEPVARWIDPVCPEVLGVAKQISKRVEDRVREIAARAGVPVSKAKCQSNLVIAFVKNGDAVVEQIQARSPHQFKDVDAQHRTYLQNANKPVRWWHAIQSRTRDGMRDTGNEAPPFAKLDAPGGVPMAGDVVFQYRSSIASTQMVRALRVATVIIDVEKAEGKTLDSVADFAAMVGLAEIRPSDPPPPNSVLSLFAAEGPTELTSLDENFLSTLYKLPLDRTAFAHRGLLVRGLVNAGAR